MDNTTTKSLEHEIQNCKNFREQTICLNKIHQIFKEYIDLHSPITTVQFKFDADFIRNYGIITTNVNTNGVYTSYGLVEKYRLSQYIITQSVDQTLLSISHNKNILRFLISMSDIISPKLHSTFVLFATKEFIEIKPLSWQVDFIDWI